MKNTQFIKKGLNSLCMVVIVVVVASLCSTVKAAPLPVFNGWTMFADDTIVNDAIGGQPFNTEYLFYKSEGTILSIGLQTGFDVGDGKITWNGRNYYGGDLALSFDGNISGAGGSGYEYAADFGLFARDYHGNDKVSYAQSGGQDTGIDPAGLYGGVTWRNDLLYASAEPFAMDDSTTGKIADALVHNSSGHGGNSYYRKVSFDTTKISETAGGDYVVHAHWTMNCGNDEIDGHFHHPGGKPIPEPTTIALLGIGLAGLGGGYLRRKRRQRLEAK
ncbi:MAG: hypothetical protein A3H23_06950 [Planctomycetes bacterium RIFCSPLOWO2_12_FULL_40_19]|nr:MAG: hypothetical protein A3H23_06950 [Planctomycetes bacterium RIFCSPLOWO2_12_FULL_40_19]